MPSSFAGPMEDRKEDKSAVALPTSSAGGRPRLRQAIASSSVSVGVPQWLTTREANEEYVHSCALVSIRGFSPIAGLGCGQPSAVSYPSAPSATSAVKHSERFGNAFGHHGSDIIRGGRPRLHRTMAFFIEVHRRPPVVTQSRAGASLRLGRTLHLPGLFAAAGFSGGASGRRREIERSRKDSVAGTVSVPVAGAAGDAGSMPASSNWKRSRSPG